jgi:hypothetical protein
MDTSAVVYLQQALIVIDKLIEESIRRAEAAGFDASDGLRGLIVHPAELQKLLASPTMASLWEGSPAAQIRLSLPPTDDQSLPLLAMVDSFGLNAIDVFILLLALAPDVDRRYERIFAFLQDDVSLRRASVHLIMNLLGGDVAQRTAVWQRMQVGMPLRDHGLIVLEAAPNRPNSAALTQLVRVDERVVGHVMGDNGIDERILNAVEFMTENAHSHIAPAQLQVLSEQFVHAPLIAMQGRQMLEMTETALMLCAAHRMPLLRIRGADLKRPDQPLLPEWRLALREGYLQRAALLVTDWDDLLDDKRKFPRECWKLLVRYPAPVFLCMSEMWEPDDAHRQRRMLRLKFAIPDFDARLAIWRSALGSTRIAESVLHELAARYRFDRTQVSRAVQHARDLVASDGAVLDDKTLQSGAQALSRIHLGQYARHVEARANWSNLILPAEQVIILRELIDRARLGHVVQNEWGFGSGFTKANGISALFAGDSGTGKTLSAQVIAGELGLPLYKIDLSGVVSKYIGETEKNLRTIFEAAHANNAILFFDEADALFGKRSEVKDAHDRYANIEVAYLLQQIEEYEGIAILATNLRQNLDDAFTRRLDFLIDFPFPDSEYRERIWAVHFPARAPLAADVNLGELAKRYELAGGNIRNAALAAAYLAAADGGEITRQHIQNAIRREHQKMGRLTYGFE